MLTSAKHLLLAALLLAQLSGACADQAAAPAPTPEIVLLDNGTTTVNTPPVEKGPFLQPDLVELTELDPSFKLDVRYATSNNFTGRPVYPEARVFLQRPAAEALVRAHDRVKQQGFGMILFDGYRPWAVTKTFWDITPTDKKEFVADPAAGSRHNRGCAVDLTLCDLETSLPVAMPTDYDDFTTASYAAYPGGTKESRRNRQVLRDAMEAEGFKVLPAEWWHFDFQGWKQYPISNRSFSELSGRTEKGTK